jgi:hypothetical protein
MDFTPGWYIVKRAADAPCEILEVSEASTIAALDDRTESADRRHWGPFASPQEAIAKRVGLIRAGKCQPQ